MNIEIAHDLSSVDREQWNALCPPDDPFTDYAFLRTLETSGSVGPTTGWDPCHILVRDGGALVGALPLYIKSHSYGEYIFDWSWAGAAQRMGVEYYPKLVSAVPFTPATGGRLLVGGRDAPTVRKALLHGMLTVAEEVDASSAHVLFHSEDDRQPLVEAGLLPRLTYQYHWENADGWATWADYLAAFRHGPRRKVKKERREAAAAGLRLYSQRASELDPESWQRLYAFYRDTTGRKGAIPYLTVEFFESLQGPLADLCIVNLAESEEHGLVAGAISFQKGGHLYGRYWGCLADFDKLHFELCYYRNIELCLENGWTRFEAGAQGQHKIARGLMPSPILSS